MPTTAYPDAIDTALSDDPNAAPCERCGHLWLLDELAHDRNGDNICPDCIYT